MNARHDPSVETYQAEFCYPIYSPKGGIEGALLQSDGEVWQIVFEPHGGPGADAFAQLEPGTTVEVAVRAEGPSDKGDAQHAVYRFQQLLAVNGRNSAEPAAGGAHAPFTGIVERLNFARHGEANGVVLDTGHFIHTKPDGMAKLKLGVGDRVEADGESRPLVNGRGMVVEASMVNGTRVGKGGKHG